MDLQTIARRCGVSLRPSGRRAAAAGSIAAAVLAALPSASQGQSLVIDQSAGNSPYTPSEDAAYSGISVGDTGNGVLYQPTSNLSSSGQVIVGNASTGVGIYNLSGSASLVSNASGGGLILGNAGAGTFNAYNNSQAIFGTNAIYLGNTSSGKGALNVGDFASVTAGGVQIGYNGTGVVNQTGGTLGSYNGSTYYSTYLGSNAGAVGTYNLLGGTFAGYHVVVGYGGVGTFNQGGNSTVNSIGTLFIGYLAAGRGSVAVTGGTAAYTGGMYVGVNGTGSYNQTGGAVNVGSGSMLVATGAGSAGTVYMSGGTYQTSGAYIGYTGTGVLQMSGGTINAATTYISAVGYSSGSVGTANISGGTINALTTYIGHTGTGTLNLSGTGTLATASANSLYVGFNASSGGGTLNLSGSGTVAGGGFAYVGYNGTGVLNQSGGTFNTGSGYSLYLARASTASRGTYLLSDGTANVASLYLGYNGSAGMTQTGGTFNASSVVFLGYTAGTGTGVLNVAGGTFNTVEFYAGYGGTGTIQLSAGVINAGTQYIQIFGNSPGSTGVFNISGGTFNGIAPYIGYSGSGIVNQTGGTFNTSNYSVTMGNASTGAGTYNLNGGTVTTSGFGVGSGAGTLNLNGGVVQSTVTDGVISGVTVNVKAGGAVFNSPSGASMTVNAVLNGASGVADGGLAKVGSGTLSLMMANTYTGPSNLSAGITTVASAASLGLGNVMVGPSASLVLDGTTAIADSATLSVYSTSSITLNASAGAETIAALLNLTTGRFELAGTYSADQLNADFGASIFSSSGAMLTIAAPEPTSLLLTAAVIGPLVVRRRRRSTVAFAG